MAKRKTRRMVGYVVCCDCQRCLSKGYVPFHMLHNEETISAAQQWLEGETQYHSSLFIAREVIEAVDPLPKRKATRKAA